MKLAQSTLKRVTYQDDQRSPSFGSDKTQEISRSPAKRSEFRKSMDALPADAKMNLTVNEAKSRQTLDYSTENIKADAPAHKCVHHYGRGHQYTNFQSSH